MSEIPKLRKLIVKNQLTGLANDTKWNELISAMQDDSTKKWRPSYRYRCIDSDFVSRWDNEFWYHLPYPFISVKWFELQYKETIHLRNLVRPQIIDHSCEIKELLSSIGFDFEKGRDAIRIYGYAPRDRFGFTSCPDQKVD